VVAQLELIKGNISVAKYTVSALQVLVCVGGPPGVLPPLSTPAISCLQLTKKKEPVKITSSNGKTFPLFIND
jgi:hypothetical protein